MHALPPRWRSIRPADISWREWDDESVVYNRQNGRTHLLSASGAAVLAALLDRKDGAALAELADSLRAENAGTTIAALHAVLTELERSGLVEVEAA